MCDFASNIWFNSISNDKRILDLGIFLIFSQDQSYPFYHDPKDLYYY